MSPSDDLRGHLSLAAELPAPPLAQPCHAAHLSFQGETGKKWGSQELTGSHFHLWEKPQAEKVSLGTELPPWEKR